MKQILLMIAVVALVGCGKKRTTAQAHPAILWEFETGVSDSSPAIGLMARFTSGQMTTSSMPSMARVGSSYGNLKREVVCLLPRHRI